MAYHGLDKLPADLLAAKTAHGRDLAMWPQEYPEPEADRYSDISERYAGERIPPFWGIDGVDEWTGQPYPEPEAG